MPLRRAWKAARLWTSGESAKASSVRSRSACESDENGACSEPANWLSHASSSPANPSRSVWEGLLPTAIRIASGTPSSVADGSPPSPGTKVSQIASRARRALPLSVISTATPHLLVDVPDHDLHRVAGVLHRPPERLRRASGVDHNLRSLAAGPLPQAADPVLRGRPGQHLRSQPRPEREPALQPIHHQHRTTALGGEQTDGLPDRARAQD